jgi:hypothetical protein
LRTFPDTQLDTASGVTRTLGMAKSTRIPDGESVLRKTLEHLETPAERALRKVEEVSNPAAAALRKIEEGSPKAALEKMDRSLGPYAPNPDGLRFRGQIEDSMADVDRTSEEGAFQSDAFAPEAFSQPPAGDIDKKPAPEPVRESLPLDPMYVVDQPVVVAPTVGATVVVPPIQGVRTEIPAPDESHYVVRPTDPPQPAPTPRVITGPITVRDSLTVSEAPADPSRALIQLSVLIDTFAEADRYDPKRHHNQPPPAMWLDNKEYLTDLRSLLRELRRLNDQLEQLVKTQAQQTPPDTAKTVSRVSVAATKFVEAYAADLGKRASGLTCVAIGGLLCWIGAETGLVDAVFATIKKLK